jgi:carboxylate-amine ligase
MAIRTFGLEEELHLVDPGTGETTARSPQVLKAFGERGVPGPASAPRPASDELEGELFRHQLETRTDPALTADDALAQLEAARRTAARAARSVDAAVVAAGTLPLAARPARVSPQDRYRDIVDRFGAIARVAGTCGMHVHVGIDSDEEGVAVLDRLRPWLPVLLAISANSPYADGEDSGYASWRAQVWSRWPTAGPQEPFGSPQRYREVATALQEYGAARDTGMLYFDARLSVDHPTVEVRVADVCTDPADALLVALLTRGLVETVAERWRAGEPVPEHRTDLLRAAHWRASRSGLADRLVHPVAGALRPAREVLDALVELVRPVLEEAGDLERVTDGVARVLAAGGASRQRASFERSGDLAAVVRDLVTRTEGNRDV